MLYGYRSWEFGLPLDGLQVDPSFRFTPVVSTYEHVAQPKIMAVSLGCHVDGAANFWPHTHDADNAALGLLKRVATLMPEYDPMVYAEFVEFSFSFIIRNMGSCVLEYDCDLTVEHWLEGTGYPQYRKDSLLEESGISDVVRSVDRVISSHIKYESYGQPKYARTINSRSDFFKTKFGPACAEIGRRFFLLPWLIKKLSQDEKIERLERLFDNCYLRAFNNDFTSFEATFRRHLMIIEVFFFCYCLQHTHVFRELMKELVDAKLGVNTLKFKWFLAKLVAKRYSGEMDTSLSNGLQDVLMMCFLLHKAGHPARFYELDYPPQIEGDDSIGVFLYPVDSSILEKIGARAKLMLFDNFREASFCGLLISEDSRSVIRDPIHALLDFGYCHYKYFGSSRKMKMKLLRAKSLSFLVMYPGCPIVKELALYGLRVTSDVSNRHALAAQLKNAEDSYQRQKWRRLIEIDASRFEPVEVTIGSRLLMEKCFGIPPSFQLDFESYLRGLYRIQPIRFPGLFDYVHTDCVRYYEQYSQALFSPGSPPSKAITSGRAWRKLLFADLLEGFL